MNLTRRQLLVAGFTTLTGLSTIGLIYNRRLLSRKPSTLVKDPQNVLDLPPEFTYQILEKTDDLMDDNFVVPGLPDGMACFSGKDNTWILMRNHENHSGKAVDSSLAYDKDRAGGVSRLVVDRETGMRISSNLVLTGTSRNCGGGYTYQGWLSCEEIDEPKHGYVFLCDPEASSLQKPRALPTLGRFPHEAAAIDPESGIIYLTEDVSASAIYRHVPNDPKNPFSGGTLQALKIKGEPNASLSEGRKIGESHNVEWIAITDPDATTIPTREQAHSQGAAILSRGEGAWLQNKSLYISSTDGGEWGRGQIFHLDISNKKNKLTLIAEANKEDTFDHPDNITVSSWGDVFLAEDSGNGSNGIWVIQPDGNLYQFAENLLNQGASEIAGLCFSPDNKWLFLNIQKEGLTIAVTGPFAT
ncbi:MAG: hypothetical protein CL402_01355 [Acidiferrobacteraceae bacterium]|jgi:secreted PhoX family phosphatase|nr:hypothetical protein [Acidiferrobacteraceae bacterium]|tara:strand:- start:15264 stop:16508 length:1245 start_codon:yes stop_codon:yes gene_type:complete